MAQTTSEGSWTPSVLFQNSGSETEVSGEIQRCFSANILYKRKKQEKTRGYFGATDVGPSTQPMDKPWAVSKLGFFFGPLETMQLLGGLPLIWKPEWGDKNPWHGVTG